MACKERENYHRFCTLVVDDIKTSLVDLLELHLSLKKLSFEDFINQHQHGIFHLYNSKKCCQCNVGYIRQKKRVLHEEQLSILFDRSSVKFCHHSGKKIDFCCCIGRSGIQTNVLDVTLAATLLVNFCHDVFWYSCLNLQSLSLEDFLNQNKHQIYHLREGNSPCCQCPHGYIFPVNNPMIDLYEWTIMFNLPELPCSLHQMRPSDLICTVSASPGIDVGGLHDNLTKIIFEQCCSLRQTVDRLVQMRNKVYGHPRHDKLAFSDYIKYRNEVEAGILAIACVCDNETITRHRLVVSETRPLDETSWKSHQTTMEAIYSRQNNLEKTCIQIKDVIEEQLTLKHSDEPCMNSPTEDENTPRRNEDIHNTVTLIEELASANASSKTQKGLKTAFEVLSLIKFIDPKISAIVATAEKVHKASHDEKLDNLLKLIESKIDQELFYKFKGAKAFFVAKIVFLTGLSIQEINENDIVLINQNVEPFKEVAFMAEMWERIDKLKNNSIKRRNFSKLMKYIQEYIFLSVLRDITFTLYLRILDVSPHFNIREGLENTNNAQAEKDQSLFQFLFQPSRDTLIFNFMYNPADWHVLDTLLYYYFPEQGKQRSLDYLCNGEYVIKSVKFNAFLYMADVVGTWLRWHKTENEQSRFTFVKEAISGKTYFRIFSSKWPDYYATIGWLEMWVRGSIGNTENEGLFEIMKLNCEKDSSVELYSFSPRDSRATFMIARASGRVSGSRCPPCPETFFKIERRNTLTA